MGADTAAAGGARTGIEAGGGGGVDDDNNATLDVDGTGTGIDVDDGTAIGGDVERIAAIAGLLASSFHLARALSSCC